MKGEHYGGCIARFHNCICLHCKNDHEECCYHTSECPVYDCGRYEEETENGWISTKTRLPEKDGEYLAIRLGAFGRRVKLVLWNQKKRKFEDLCDGWIEEYDAYHFTHWAEIPDMPEE